MGAGALFNNTNGGNNVALGHGALFNNISGGQNVVLGHGAGLNITTASNVICIGDGVAGEDESGSCYIGNIFGASSAGGIAVFINGLGQLGTATSSRRFKDDIKPMDKASEVILALKPVTFRYKKDIDPQGTWQFGLVAEEVDKVNRDLVVRDKEGKVYSVRYDQVNAMLLNEFLKEHRKVEQQDRRLQEQEATIARQRNDFQKAIAQQASEIKTLSAGLKEQAAQIQKVSAQLKVNGPAPQVVLNTP